MTQQDIAFITAVVTKREARKSYRFWLLWSFALGFLIAAALA